jgi:hypothetical protein
MKKSFFICILLVLLFACSKFYLDKFPQTWQLIKISSDQVPNDSGTTGTDMPYQELYLLNSDGTFIKSREKDGITTEASGSFSVIESEGEKYFELIYNSSNDPLISSCSPGKEVLWIKSEKTIVGTWSYCDGPILEYQRIK